MALRTLRQLPKVVGQTGAGAAIYEVRSARLVLRGDAAHFNRLVVCDRCGREVPGRAVLSPADLDQAPRAVVCNDCVKVATEPAVALVANDPELDPADHAEMNQELEVLVEELGGPEDGEAMAAGEGDAGEEEEAERVVGPVAEEEGWAFDASDGTVEEVAELLNEPQQVEAADFVPEPDANVIEPDPWPPTAGAGGEVEDRRLADLEQRLEEAIERLSDEAGLRAGLEARIEQLGADALERSRGSEHNEQLRRRVDGLVEQVEQLRATVDAEWARGKAEVATLTEANEGLAESVAGLETRIEHLADQVAGTLDAMMAQRSEMRTGLLAGLAEVRAAVPAPAEDVASRLEAMESQVRGARAEVSDMNELHAALDAGLGTLRGDLAELRTALAREADSRADQEDRLESFVRASLVPEGQTGRKAKKSAESTLGTLSTTVQELLREQRRLRDDVVSLQRATDGATSAANRAMSQASSVGPIRRDVELLYKQAAEQNEALAALRRAVEALRRPPPAPAKPPARKAPAKRAAPAAKAASKTRAAKAKSPAAEAAPATRASRGKKA